MANLTTISDRLTPSVPIQITYGAQPVATGKKFTTLFGHKAATGDTAQDYFVYTVTNVGDPVAAHTEVDALAGVGSQIGKMAYAFVAANALSGAANFPAFRVVLLPFAELHFGPASEAIQAVQLLRSDMFVSCYPASDAVNLLTLKNLAVMISGPDRDLNGQFGSFMTVGSIDASAAALIYAINSLYVEVAYLQDTNTALVNTTGDTQIGANANKLINLASTAGIYPGATISGVGIPAGALVQSVAKSSVVMSVNATAAAAAEALVFQNVVSQAPEIVAAGHAGAQMSSAFPYNPLQGVAIGGLVAPQKNSDRIAVDPNGLSEQCLAAGLSPLTVQPGGVVGFIRTRTTYNLKPDGVTAITAYFDWQDIVALYDFREDCYSISQNPPFNNNPGGTKASQTIAALFKDEVLRQAQSYEDRGCFQGVKTLAPLFLVQPSVTSRGRFDFKIPVNVLPGLYVIAGNIQAVSDLGNFSL